VTPQPASFGYDPLGLDPSTASAPTDAGPALRLRLASPVIGAEELAAVQEALESGVLTNGPWTRRFEAAMADHHGTAHAVAMANGTVALAAMLLAAGIGPGDEVIVPSLTFIATATSVLHVGATPVFADIEPTTLTLCPDDTERRITPRTRAIMPVHYGGQMAQMDRFRELADAHGLVLLEDAAQAHGATFGGRPSGSWGDAGMFSFTPVKMITTGEGAVVTTNDEALARQMRLLRNHGMAKQYHHEIVGWNWRLTEMQAAIGVRQLDRLEGLLAIKQANARALAAFLDEIEGVSPPATPADRTHPFTIYTVTLPADRRDAVADALAAAGIETRIYFPPAHRQPIFASAVGDAVDLPVTDEMAGRILSLPFHTRVTTDDLHEMATVIRRTLEG
jgi:perosamine synthetase